MRKIGGLFGRSPFGPLHEHMAKVHDCVEQIPPLMEAFIAAQWDEVVRLGEEIDRFEAEADEIKHGIRNSISSSIFSSSERGDILSILKTQDSVADRCKDVSVLTAMRRTVVPDFLKPVLAALARQVKSTTDILLEVSHSLCQVFEQSYDQAALAAVMERIDDIHRSEHEADQEEKRFLELMFEREKELDPVSIFLLMKVVGRVGSVADSAENVGDSLRGWIESR